MDGLLVSQDVLLRRAPALAENGPATVRDFLRVAMPPLLEGQELRLGEMLRGAH